MVSRYCLGPKPTASPSGVDGLVQTDLRLTGGTVTQTFGSSPLPTNNWSHIAVTYDGSFVKGYLNGELLGAVAASGTVKNSQNVGTPLMIGNEPDGTLPTSPPSNGFGWHGLIDELGFTVVAYPRRKCMPSTLPTGRASVSPTTRRRCLFSSR